MKRIRKINNYMMFGFDVVGKEAIETKNQLSIAPSVFSDFQFGGSHTTDFY